MDLFDARHALDKLSWESACNPSSLGFREHNIIERCKEIHIFEENNYIKIRLVADDPDEEGRTVFALFNASTNRWEE